MAGPTAENAGIWWRVDGGGKGQSLGIRQFASPNDLVRGATETTDWTRYKFDLPVPPGARNINFGLVFNGTGTAWFDALSSQSNTSVTLHINSQHR